MSLLTAGKISHDWLKTEIRKGEFRRMESRFRSWITENGRMGPSGEGGFVAEPERYHLYVSHACPWAHRTLIFRKLKKLEDVISVSVVHPYMGEQGWEFRDYPGATSDTINHSRYLYELYNMAQADYSGIVTVPILWDTKRETIVNNESSEIIRMFNSAFNAWGDTSVDLYPIALRDEIDAINQRIYHTVNNGVYRAGFATSQEVYEHAFDALFETLDDLELHLSQHRYLVGEQITEADWRLFTTLVRFDAVYYSHFKCNRQRLIDYPSLWAYTRELYQIPGIADTVNMDHIKTHYFTSHPSINPNGIIPKGPEVDFTAPHDRHYLQMKETRHGSI
ncbi:MAG: glutathione S-transferase family protein [Gammaproteobacteria bacterium]|nr:glutathione S-transferase family protein [Gammaproteobacteria bacterium]